MADHDPFSLGDSDEEDRKREGERVKEDAGVGTGTGDLREGERSAGGVRERQAEELVGK